MTSAGTIEASVTVGGVKAVVSYTITNPPAPQETQAPGGTQTPTEVPQTTGTQTPAAKDEAEEFDEVVTDDTGVKYGVTEGSGTSRQVSYLAPSSKKAKTVKAPKTVKIKGKTYKVTAIAPSVFAGSKKLKKVTIGENITSIGKKAFYRCSNLQSIVIKSKKLKAKTVGEKAFTGVHKKAVVKVPKKYKKKYRTWLKERGIPAL